MLFQVQGLVEAMDVRTQVQGLGGCHSRLQIFDPRYRKDPLEKEVAPHSSTIASKIPWKEEPGRLQSMGLQRVRHD